MIRLIRKISVIALACILVLNAGTATSMVMGNCSTSADAGQMDMDHCDGLLNFALPMQGCCGDCLDVFCDLFKNPIKDANTVTTFAFQDYVQDIYARSGDIWEEADSCPATAIWGSRLSAAPISCPTPLYIEHRTLII